MEKQQNTEVETVENNEQAQDENGNENQAQIQDNDEQSEKDIEKRKKYEEQQIARINLIFGKLQDLEKLNEKYEEEFKIIAEKRAEVENLKKATNEKNDENEQEINANDNESNESSEPNKSKLETPEKELKDAEKKLAEHWGLNPGKLSDKIEVFRKGYIATVVPENLPIEGKIAHNEALEKLSEIDFNEKLPKFVKFLKDKGINTKLEQFGNNMAKFEIGCEPEVVSSHVDEFCKLEEQKEREAQKEKEEREKKEKEENEKKSIKDKAEDAKKEADEQNENNKPESTENNNEVPNLF